MERLSDKAIEIINDLHTERLDYTFEYLPLIEAAQKLSAYEDTEMEPEEIVSVQEEPWCVFYANTHCNLDGDFCQGKWECQMRMSPEDSVRLMKLAQAEKDGRLVVLPCKFGDTIWVILDDGSVQKAKVSGISVVSTCDDIIIQFGGWPTGPVLGSEVSKTWFFTKKEAEEKTP